MPSADFGKQTMDESVTLNASSTGTVSWSNGVLNNTPFNATLGSASYTATAVGSNGCIVTDQVTITGMSLPNIQAGNNQSICLGNAVTLSASGGISYTWNNGVLNNVPNSHSGVCSNRIWHQRL